MCKRAIILAGGKGTRLKPYSIIFPKPLMPIGDKPILEIIINQLARYGFTHITITVNHLADIIKAFFNDGKRWGIKIDYSLEEIPLNTMGPLSLINDLPENFLIMNGDVLTDLNFSDFYSFHTNNQNIFTVSTYPRIQKSEYGVIQYDANSNKMIGFQEKPEIDYMVSMGVYMANKKILDHIAYNTPYGFDNLMLDLLKNDTPAQIKPYNGYWLDIGRPDDYEKAIEDIEKFKI